METGMSTRKNELYTAAELEDFSKIEVIDKYVLLAIKYETMADNLERMEEFLRLANHSAYGTSSEKRLDADQLNFFDRIPNGVFNEAEAIAEETEKQEQQEEKAQPKARRMVGEVGAHKSCFDHLPVEEVLHDLDDPNCPHCHSQLKELKTVEKRTEIVLIPARLVKRRHMEKVYVCDHCQETGEHSPIIESPTPLPVLSGSYVSASLMAYIMLRSTGKRLRSTGWRHSSKALDTTFQERSWQTGSSRDPSCTWKDFMKHFMMRSRKAQ